MTAGFSPAGAPVKGYCPMGCGATLTLDVTGVVVCGAPGCLEPHSVTTILMDNEPEHIVEFTDDGFISRHPLWERVHTKLSDCTFQEQLANSLTGPPVPPGTYRVSRRPGGEWTYQSVPKESIHG